MRDFLNHLAAVHRRHQALYDTIASSHPSLLAGIVWCGRCGRSRKVDAAKSLRDGWPKCCCATMGIDKPGELVDLGDLP
jgi:hypothetical protein